MKNFLEASATDANLDIVLEMKPIFENGYPDIEVLCNDDVLFSGELRSAKKIILQKHCNDLLLFAITLKNKKYDRLRETACVLENLSIDRYQIIPNYNCTISYTNDHDVDVKTNYIGYNGTWKLEIQEPFYHWHHKISGQGMLIQP